MRLLDCSVLRGELCFVLGSICAIIDRCSVLRGELCFVFGSICAIIGLFRSQRRTLLRVWIDLCEYWQLFGSQGEHWFVVCIGFCLIIIDNYLVLRENIASWFGLDYIWLSLLIILFSGRIVIALNLNKIRRYFVFGLDCVCLIDSCLFSGTTVFVFGWDFACLTDNYFVLRETIVLCLSLFVHCSWNRNVCSITACWWQIWTKCPGGLVGSWHWNSFEKKFPN